MADRGNKAEGTRLVDRLKKLGFEAVGYSTRVYYNHELELRLISTADYVGKSGKVRKTVLRLSTKFNRCLHQEDTMSQMVEHLESNINTYRSNKNE